MGKFQKLVAVISILEKQIIENDYNRSEKQTLRQLLKAAHEIDKETVNASDFASLEG